MSMIDELKAEEGRLLGKIQAKAAAFEARDPTLSRAAALAKSIEALPVVYGKYHQLRGQMQLLGLRPQLLK